MTPTVREARNLIKAAIIAVCDKMDAKPEGYELEAAITSVLRSPEGSKYLLLAQRNINRRKP